MDFPRSESILRIARSDSDGDYVLVNVSPNGPSPLDLKLLATEGESPFVGTLKQSRVTKLRDRRNKQTDSEWEAVLLQILLQYCDHTKAPNKNPAKKLEVVANLVGEHLAIKFRNNISGITQGLGEILLKQDQNQEINLTSWAAKAVERSNGLEEEVQQLAVKYGEQSKTMEKLNQQLEDLIEAKKKHEDVLLENFRELLNAKKLKIRDQQRLLAGVKIDGKQVEKLRAGIEISKARAPTSSRAGKRKTPGIGDECSEDSGFENKEPRPQLELELSEQENTPEISGNDTTEDENEDNIGTAADRSPLPARTNHAATDEMQVDQAPPKRELPFENSNQRNTDLKKSELPLGTSRRDNARHYEQEDNDDDDDEL